MDIVLIFAGQNRFVKVEKDRQHALIVSLDLTFRVILQRIPIWKKSLVAFASGSILSLKKPSITTRKKSKTQHVVRYTLTTLFYATPRKHAPTRSNKAQLATIVGEIVSRWNTFHLLTRNTTGDLYRRWQNKNTVSTFLPTRRAR